MDKRIVFTDGMLGHEWFATNAVKMEATEVDGQKVLVGKAIVYGYLSDDRGGYRVRIAPGSARYSDDVLALYNHEYPWVIGNTANGTLSLTEAQDGIDVRIVLPDTTIGNDTYTLVKDGYVRGMSFGTIPQKWKTYQENGEKIIEYTEMLVDEVTVTPIPAWTETSIKVEEEPDQQLNTTPDELRLAQLRLDVLRE